MPSTASSARISSAICGRPARSLAYDRVSCAITLISRTPCPASMRASATTDSGVRLWNLPRIDGDRAERADAVAALGDLQVGASGARRAGAAASVSSYRCVRPASTYTPRERPATASSRICGDVLELAGADEGVDLGQLLGQLGAVALGQAARDDQRAQAAALLLVGQLEDRVDRLLARARDERAGVHDRDVRVGQILGDRAARERELPEHDLGVDLVLRAAERPEEDAGRGGGGRHRRGRLA